MCLGLVPLLSSLPVLQLRNVVLDNCCISLDAYTCCRDKNVWKIEFICIFSDFALYAATDFISDLLVQAAFAHAALIFALTLRGVFEFIVAFW